MRFIISLLVGFFCLMLISPIGLGVLSDLLGRQSKTMEWFLNFLSIIVSSMIAGYLLKKKGWFIGFVLSCVLIAVILSSWHFFLHLTSDAILIAPIKNKAVLVEFAGYVVLGTSFGAIGSYMYRKRKHYDGSGPADSELRI